MQSEAVGPRFQMLRVQPEIETERLSLRPFRLRDAGKVCALLSDPAFGEAMPDMPYPYRLEDAQHWIAQHGTMFFEGGGAIYAVWTKEEQLIGAYGVRLQHPERRGDLGYWIGSAFWRRGYGTEAGQAVVRFALASLNCSELTASHRAGNQGSARILQKLGFTPVGTDLLCSKTNLGEYEVVRYRYGPERSPLSGDSAQPSPSEFMSIPGA